MARSSAEAPARGAGRRGNCRITIIGCLIFLALGIFVYCATSDQTGIRSLSDCPYTELESGALYKAEDLTVISRFAAEPDEAGDASASVTDYYLTVFYDKTACPVAAVLSVDDNDDIYARLSGDMTNEDPAVGDCPVTGYVKIGDRLANLNDGWDKDYREALAAHGFHPDEYMACLEYMLVYDCNGYSDPLTQFLANRYEKATGP